MQVREHSYGPGSRHGTGNTPCTQTSLYLWREAGGGGGRGGQSPAHLPSAPFVIQHLALLLARTSVPCGSACCALLRGISLIRSCGGVGWGERAREAISSLGAQPRKRSEEQVPCPSGPLPHPSGPSASLHRAGEGGPGGGPRSVGPCPGPRFRTQGTRAGEGQAPPGPGAGSGRLGVRRSRGRLPGAKQEHAHLPAPPTLQAGQWRGGGGERGAGRTAGAEQEPQPAGRSSRQERAQPRARRPCPPPVSAARARHRHHRSRPRPRGMACLMAAFSVGTAMVSELVLRPTVRFCLPGEQEAHKDPHPCADVRPWGPEKAPGYRRPQPWPPGAAGRSLSLLRTRGKQRGQQWAGGSRSPTSGPMALTSSASG